MLLPGKGEGCRVCGSCISCSLNLSALNRWSLKALKFARRVFGWFFPGHGGIHTQLYRVVLRPSRRPVPRYAALVLVPWRFFFFRGVQTFLGKAAEWGVMSRRAMLSVRRGDVVAPEPSRHVWCRAQGSTTSRDGLLEVPRSMRWIDFGSSQPNCPLAHGGGADRFSVIRDSLDQLPCATASL